MVILAVDDGDADGCFCQSFGGIQPAKAGAHDHNPRWELDSSSCCLRSTSIRFTRWQMVPEVLRLRIPGNTVPWARWFMPSAVRPDLCRASWCVLLFTPLVREATGRCRHWMAYPNRPADSGDSRDPADRSVFVHDGRQAVVRVGVAVRRGRRANWMHVAGLNGVAWLTAVVIAVVFGWMFRLLVAAGDELVYRARF